MLGDSVTMGYGLDLSGTMPHWLEQLLVAYNRTARSHQMINAAVEGYATNHEYGMLRQSLVFAPDFITVGVCLNDLTEPAVLNRDLGGVGRFSGVLQLPWAFGGLLVNETGFGRLISWWQSPAADLVQRQLAQRYNVDALVRSAPDDPRFDAGWRLVLDNLAAIYALARERGIDVVLLVYPFVFQLFDPELQAPQRRLLMHARAQGVDAIDLTPVFEKRICADVDQILGEVRQTHDLVPEDVDLIRVFQAKRYFFDEDHPTSVGNQVVAVRLAEYLQRQGMVELELDFFLTEQQRVLGRSPNEFEFRMPHSPQDIARTAYILFLYNQDMEKIRGVFDIGLSAASDPSVRAQFYRALGEIERARGNEEAVEVALRRAAEQ